MMQRLYAIHVNNVGQVSVDVYSEKHTGAAKWRMYFAVKPQTVQRLRRIYAANKKCFYISHQWSASRWKAYKTWSMSWHTSSTPLGAAGSLDHLATSGH